MRECYGGASGVTFTGFVQGTQLAELYAAADVFLFPSATETFGNVVLESMASGTTVIGAAAGGVQDTIEHEVTGLLCPSGDVAAFTQAIVRLYESQETRHRLAIAGREFALRQSWDHIFNQLLTSYEEVVYRTSANQSRMHATRMIR